MPNDERDLLAEFRRCPNDHARAVVLADIGLAYRGTNDKRVGRFLAEIICDENQSRDMRLGALCVLFELASRPLDTLGSIVEFKLPEDLDLEFINSYL